MQNNTRVSNTLPDEVPANLPAEAIRPPCQDKMPPAEIRRLVLDTNIVMDMLLFDNRSTQPLLAALQRGELTCFTDPDCLAELERVTGYPEFALDPEQRAELMARYLDLVTICPASGNESYVLPRCRDTDDQKFLILAARCQAGLLLTRDKLLLKLARHKHKPPPCPIVTAEAALPLLDLV